MNLLWLGPAIFRQTLEADADYQAAMAWQGLTKTFGNFVPADVEPPYVTVEHYAGGMDNNSQTQSSDTLWTVAALARQDEEAVLVIAGLIHDALHDVWPEMGGIEGVAGYHPIELKTPFSDVVNRQGVMMLRAGGIYSLRLAETKG